MLLTIKNLKDYIIGYVETNKVNQLGDLDREGTFIRIENLWIHPKYRGYKNNKILTLLAKRVYSHPFYKKCNKVFWIILKDKNNKKIIDDEYREYSKKYFRIHNKEYLLKQPDKELIHV